MWFLNLILTGISATVLYLLDLTYLGRYNLQKKSWLLMAVFSCWIYMSNNIFRLPRVIHTVILVLLCFFLLYLFERIDLISSVVTALLGVLTVMMGEFLITTPIALLLKIKVTGLDPNSLPWVLLSMIDLFFPILIILILRAKKLSLAWLSE